MLCSNLFRLLKFCFFISYPRQHSQWHTPWQQVQVWLSVHIWTTWAQAWAWCPSCCPALPCWSLGVPPAWQPCPTAPPHTSMHVQTSWRYAACAQCLRFGVVHRQTPANKRLPSTRSVGNSSAATAQGARATAATLIRWRRAWWTAARTRSLSAWTTLKAAAVETSASTFIHRLTCKPGLRLRSTKSVKTRRLRLWWVLLNEEATTYAFNLVVMIQSWTFIENICFTVTVGRFCLHIQPVFFFLPDAS